MKRYWVAIERLQNWRVDKRTGFKTFGVSLSTSRLASKTRPGDLVFMYVSSGRSAFADIREVTSESLGRLRMGGEYDDAFPLCIQTRSVAALPMENWIRFHGLAPKLSFTRRTRDWRQVMRRTLREINADDARIIVKAFEQAGAQIRSPELIAS